MPSACAERVVVADRAQRQPGARPEQEPDHADGQQRSTGRRSDPGRTAACRPAECRSGRECRARRASTPAEPTKLAPIMPRGRGRAASATGRSPPGWWRASASGQPNSSENSAPASDRRQTRRARAIRSVSAAAKPLTAPIIIMPSTPRLSTPERSTTSSPMRRDQQRRRRGGDGRRGSAVDAISGLPPPSAVRAVRCRTR